MDRDLATSALRSCFARRAPEIVAAYLFGSMGRGEAGPHSDADVGVILAAGPPRSVEEYPFDIAPELERALGVPVDVVVLNGAPADLVHRVLRDGALVYEGDRAARVAFEVQARNEYFDLAPVLIRYRAAVLRSV